jgi:hypothetical protein
MRMRRALRSLLTVLSLTAWFALSNHCALGIVAAPEETAAQMNGCPMHSAPDKKEPAMKTPCCKEVRALVAKCVTVSPIALRLIGLQNYATTTFASPPRLAIAIEELDTGPPRSLSFAESVLQESVFSHAPPVS